jgi:glutamine cyclotransferase
MHLRAQVAVACLLGLLTLFAGARLRAEPAPLLRWRVVSAHPHDPAAFTQGLLLHDGVLYESTGLRGRSQVRRVQPASGRVLLARNLDGVLFAEGLALVDQRLFQLTWQAGRGFIYSVPELRLLGEFSYPGEGWGLAYDGTRLFMSDGSDRLRIIDPQGFVERSRLAVHDDGAPVARLNELEFARGRLFANVWGSDRIARIDPRSGRVTGWLDLGGLLGPMAAGADVLNGIAYDDATDQLWVTGKLWPRIFVLEVAE